jgi:hypothetical protein
MVRCRSDIVRQLRRCALEKGVELQAVTLEAMTDFLAKNRHLLDKGIIKM